MKRKDFAARLVALMEEKKITVKEAAKLAGVSPSTLQNWRSGHQPTDYRAVESLAHALDTSLRYLLFGENSLTSKSKKNLSTKEMREIIENALYELRDRITIHTNNDHIEIKLKHTGD